MYKNRKFNKNAKNGSSGKALGSNENKRPLNVIDEDASVKFARTTLSIENSSKRTKTATSTVVAADVCTAEAPTEENSDELVPASQELTQRYLSQRSAIASTLGRTQPRNASGRLPNSYFELVLTRAGVLLDEADNFVLSCDHVSFVNKIREIFTKTAKAENIEMFKNGLSEALSPKCKYCLKLLSGCTINVSGQDSVYQSQESMIVNFLMVDFLRDAVVDVLLKKISEAARQSTPPFLANGTVPLLPLLIAQLRYVSQSHSKLIFERISAIFKEASDLAKRDLVLNAEFFLDAGKHDDFVQMLLENLAVSKDFFNANSIQALTNLSLGRNMQEQLRHRILDHIKEDEFDNTNLPLMTNFLLKSLTEASDEEVIELVNTIRQILVLRLNTPMERSTQLELFNFLEQALVRCKKFYTNWQKLLSLLPGSQFRSLDFIILLLLIHIKEDNYLYIENILRRRIKLEHITVDIFVEMKSNYAAVLEQHTPTIMQLMHDFLREKNKIVASFAKASYGILFQICETIQRGILKRLLQLTCDKSSQSLTNLALELLRDLQRKYRAEIQNWGMLLMPLLDRLNEMSLSQTRLAMEILCSIAFPPPPLSECTVLQDQLDMLLKKQIINHSVHVKKQGIIGSVQLIDCMARIEDTIIEHDDFDTSYTNASSLPDGRGKMAANFIMLVESAAVHCSESLALFYDELACSCMCMPSERDTCTQLDKPYLIWLCDVMTFYFQNSFVAEHSPSETFGIKLTYQKCINTIEDTSNMEESEVPPIAINISELVLKPGANSSTSILVLAPLFNLVRSLHLQRYQGSLEQINALLGCAIILPSFFEESNTDAIFYDYDEQVQKRILDIYFHCVNWMRETVSSFSTQQEEMIRSKVLQRLTDLIATEDKVRLLLDKAPADYVPPQAQFITSNSALSEKTEARGKPAAATTKPTQQKGPNDKDFDSETIIFNDTHAVNATNAADITMKLANFGRSKNAENKKKFDILYGPREVYRQMDSDIMLILREELVLRYPLPAADIGKRIGLLEFRFILNDLVCKLESITGAQKFQSEQPLQHVAKPEYFMCDLSKFLHAIMKSMSRLSTDINKLLEQVKHVYSNADLFTTELNYIKVCFNMCVRLLAVFFSWPQFSDGKATEALLKDSLLVLLDDAQRQNFRKKSSIEDIAAAAFDMILNYEISVVDLKTAVYLHDLLKLLKRFTNKSPANSSSSSNGGSSLEQRKSLMEKQEKDIRSLCKKFLQRKWYSYDGLAERGSTCNLYLDILVKGFLKNSDFKRLSSILRALLEECKHLKGKDNALKSFPNFKKPNFPLLFRGLCETTIGYLCELVNRSSTHRDDKMKMWEKSCELFNMLLDIVKSLDVPRNFQLFLKYAHVYLKMLLQNGLQVFDQKLRNDPERVSEFLKNLQTVTRFLHNLCCHSKALRNTAIIVQIPALRETVETLVFRVKAIMTANKCSSVFIMGNLKNKDLHGDEILTQSSLGGGESDHDSEEDIPDDDDSVDETVLDQDDDAANTRASSAGSNSNNLNNRSKSSSRSKCF